MYAASASIRANRLSDAGREFWIPGSRQADPAEDCGGTVIPHSHGAIRHFQARQTYFLVGADVEVIDSSDQVNFFF
jgi:hypothetical protein